MAGKKRFNSANLQAIQEMLQKEEIQAIKEHAEEESKKPIKEKAADDFVKEIKDIKQKSQIVRHSSNYNVKAKIPLDMR